MSLLIKNADWVVTMDSKSRILKHASLYIEKNLIREIDSKRTKADRVINARGKIVIPGLINTHHHMFQCALRGFPELQNQKIEQWIAIICKKTKQMNDEDIYYCALANMAELMLYGCTTTTDMHYIFPRGKKGFFEAIIGAAKDIGVRFHPYRGSMSLSKKDGAFFPDDIVEDSEKICSETESVIRRYHNSSPGSMIRIGVAPCTIFTSSTKDYRAAVILSKKYGVNIQTHLSESEFENKYAMKKFSKRPLEYIQSLEWTGRRVSFVHCINLNQNEITALITSGSNVVHCPISNARSPIGETGIAPIWEMLRLKMNVAMGVDGSAGNDSSNLVEEMRWARTMQGVRNESTYLHPVDVLAMGTVNGAKLLNWETEIGSLEDGKVADLALFDLNQIETAGPIFDPVCTLVSTHMPRANTVIVNGKVVVANSKLDIVNESKIVSKLRYLGKKLNT